MDKRDLIQNPPEKVLAMYQAVDELINEGSDVNSLKVADITSRAGIGKGTAYEYFSSKEELMSLAILYYAQVCMEKLQKIAVTESSFRQKIYNMMDFIDTHVREKQAVFFLIKMIMESYEIPKSLKDEYERMKHECCDTGKNEILDRIVEDGVREGMIREENPFLQRAAVETQLSVYFMYRIAAEKNMELDLEEDVLREYIYRNILKLLG